MKRILPAIFALLLGSSLILSVESCEHLPYIPDNTDTTGNGGNDTTTTEIPCSPDSVYFERQILPILASNCAMSGCHDETTHEEGIILTNYQRVRSTGKLNLSKPSESKIYEVLFKDGDDKMPPPPRASLTKAQSDLLLKWIQQGAKDLKCDDLDCDTSNVTFALNIKPVIEANCTGCHSGNKPSGNMLLVTYDDIKVQGANGKLVGSIMKLPSYKPMPEVGKLSNCNIAKIRTWVRSGMPNN